MATKKQGSPSAKKSSATKASSAAGAGASKPAMSTQDKLARRKLDALKRGIHRITDEETTPFNIHVLQ